MIVVAVGAYDSQWQNADEVANRLGGLLDGLTAHWPATAHASPLLLLNSLSSCPRGQLYSVYMGEGAHKGGTFRNLPNASALIPRARSEALSRGVLFLDTSYSQLSVPALRTSPCHYDLPIGVMSEALVQIVLNAVFRP